MGDFADVFYRMPMMASVAKGVTAFMTQLSADLASEDKETRERAQLLMATITGTAMQKAL